MPSNQPFFLEKPLLGRQNQA